MVPQSGIDEIRDLRERVKFAPSQGRYKVYVIDEVHMLTTEAFNALLKTLEEPPQHVVFIFATTEAHKLPATILSRCQRFDFRRLSQSVIVDRMRQVSAASDIDVAEEALELLAEAANGGMRDALAMLDQVYSYAGDRPITAGDVRDVVGIVPYVEYAAMWTSLLTGDMTSVLRRLWQLIDGGKEIPQIVSGFIRFCRDFLLFQSDADLLPQERRPYFQPLQAEGSNIIALVDELLDVERELRFASDPKILLEIALFRFMQRIDVEVNKSTSVPVAAAATMDMDMPSTSFAGQEAAKEQVAVLPPREQEDLTAMPVSHADTIAPAAQEEEMEHVAVPENGVPESHLHIRQVRQEWPQLVAKIMSKAPALGAKLANGRIKQLREQQLTLQFDKSFAKRVVEQPDNLAILRQELQDRFGQAIEVKCSLAKQEKKASKGESEDEDLDVLQVALSLFEGQEIDSDQVGGVKKA